MRSRPFTRRIIGERIAVVAEQPPARGTLGQESLGANVAMLHVHVPVLETEGRDDAVAVERIGVTHLGRELLVRPDPEERAVQLWRDRALHFQVVERPLEPERSRRWS